MSDHDHLSVGGCAICRATPEDPERAGFSRRSLVKKGAVAAVATAAFASTAGRAQAAAHDKPSTSGNVPKRGKPILIEAGWVLTLQGGALKLLRDQTVVVENDLITSISSGRKPGNDHRIDASRHLLLPGFISGHTHVAGATPTRGIIEAGRSFARPLEVVELLTDAELDDLTAFNLAELLLSGCTTQIEQALSLRQAKSYARVAARFAARGYPAGMIPGIHRLFPIWFRTGQQALLDSEAGTLAEIADNLAFGLQWNHAEEDRIRPQMAPHAADTQTPATLAAIAAAARQLGNGIHTHLLQRASENTTANFFSPGKRAIQWLDDYGFFDGPFFGAHMSAADLTIDPALLKAVGGMYSHCPSAGGAGGGTQPWPEILAAGVATNIGIDTHSNDYLENLKLAVLYGQARTSLRNPSPVPIKSPTIWDAMRAATVHPADELGRSDLGRIVVGAKADLTAVDVSGFMVGTGALPPEPLNNLLYTSGLGVRMTMTDGIVQVLDGQLVIEDSAKVVERGGTAIRKVWDILASENWFTPTPT